MCIRDRDVPPLNMEQLKVDIEKSKEEAHIKYPQPIKRECITETKETETIYKIRDAVDTKQKQTHNVGIKQQPGNEVKKEEKEQEKEQEMLTPSTANVEQAFHPHMETSKLEVPKKLSLIHI